MEETKTTATSEMPENEETKKATDTKAEKAEKKKAKKTEAELADLKKKLEAAEAETKACEDKYLRMMAEYDNFRKRSAKEKEGVYADAYADCIAGILPILDNLERASHSDNLDAVKKGLELTAKAFDDALSKMGITEIETKTFDPNLHNAVMHVEDEALGESEIVEVFQKGYVKGDKVIRYAMVKVAN
ncbi:MAG: nucleotide exchange factor GrpE [Ruminococcaceae bacterium]|nr:nucleotide exchange factor GrpE [Oscillospiraceae bacterium]